MSINLGLSRIRKLVDKLAGSSWKAFHVAGTNGKGSVCAYLSSCLVTAGYKTGRFTSPHLVHEWDCVSLNDHSVDEPFFRQSYRHVAALDACHGIGASPFELLTATAFHIFNQKGVQVAVVEVGLGGADDATNVLKDAQVLASLITKVGLDHQDHLGATLTEIARAKAGIVRPGRPCVADGSNDPEVLQTIREVATSRNAKFHSCLPTEFASSVLDKTPLLGDHQKQNVALALKGLQASGITGVTNHLDEGISKVQWPARLQWTQLNGIHVLVDGAHNPQAAEQLARYLNTSVRSHNKPCVFLVAFTQGKNYKEILQPLLHPRDRVIVTTYGKVAGMPWISCAHPQDVAAAARQVARDVTIVDDAVEALKVAGDSSIVCGSLYLASELFKASNTTKL